MNNHLPVRKSVDGKQVYQADGCYTAKVICIRHLIFELLHAVVNFINILGANFTYESLFGSFFYLHVTREKLSKRRYKKIRKMLMKLTPGRKQNRGRQTVIRN